MEEIRKIDEEIRLYQSKIEELINAKKHIKSNLLDNADPYKLLTSKNYRIDIALSMTDTIKEASNLLKVSERTIYRHLEEK